MDEQRGRVMWDRVMKLTDAQERNGSYWPTESAELADQIGQFEPPVQSYS